MFASHTKHNKIFWLVVVCLLCVCIHYFSNLSLIHMDAIVLFKHHEAHGFRGRIYYEWKMMKKTIPSADLVNVRFRLFAMNACPVRVSHCSEVFNFNDPNPLAMDIFGGNTFYGDIVIIFHDDITEHEREQAYQEMRNNLIEAGWEYSTFMIDDIRCVSPIMIVDLT